MKLSSIISKKVLNIYSAKIVGTICDALFEKGRVAYLKGFDENEEEFVIDTKRLYKVSENVVLIKNSLATTNHTNFAENFFVSILGKEAFSTEGYDAGIVDEIEIDEHFFIKSLHTSKCEIKSEEILLVDGVVVFTKKNEKRTKFKPKMPQKAKNEQKVNILDINIDNVKKVETLNTAPKIEISQMEINNNPNKYVMGTNQIPQKIVGLGSGSFLQGRKATKTIFGFNNEVLIKEGALVTTKVINTCTSHGKLMELALNSV